MPFAHCIELTRYFAEYSSFLHTFGEEKIMCFIANPMCNVQGALLANTLQYARTQVLYLHCTARSRRRVIQYMRVQNAGSMLQGRSVCCMQCVTHCFYFESYYVCITNEFEAIWYTLHTHSQLQYIVKKKNYSKNKNKSLNWESKFI